ncbi:hypothetical protein FDG06_12660 [Clostridium botulinum]|nr:hypothetical protein [Clostridium botulinum]
MGNFKPAWDLEYDCSVLPSASGWHNVVGGNMMSIIDEMLYINDNSISSGSYFEMKNVINDSNIVTLECTIKVMGSNKHFSVQMQINDNKMGMLIGLEPSKLTIIDANLSIIKSIDIDLTDFNIIKIIKYGQSKFELYINNKFIYENSLNDNGKNYNGLIIGAGSTAFLGELYIKNVRYCLDGIPIYYSGSYLINQNENYYSTNSNFLNLGQLKDNTRLEKWYNKYGADDVNIITQNLNNKEFPMSKDESGIWKTDFQLDMNEVIDSIELIDTDENNKSIKYNCNDYRILDLCDDQFKLTMCKSK